MVKNFYTGINLNKNPLNNAQLQNIGSDPGTPVLGQTYFNTGSNKIRTWNGSTWDEYGTSTAAGTVTGVSIVPANGFAGTVATSTTTPAITLTATPTGIIKSNGTAISAATSGTDYEVPLTFSTGLTRSTNTVTVNSSQNITTLSNLTSNGLVKTSGGGGTLSIATSGTDYAPATSGSSILKGNGSGGTTTATSGTDYLLPSGSGAALTGITESQITNLTSDLAAKAPLASPTFTGTVTVPTTVNSTDAAQKAYVDSVAQGLNAKPSVFAVATSNITLSGTQTVDGVALVATNRVLVVGQSTASQNGIWLVNASTWTRPTDFASASTQLGTYVFVEGGTANAASGWVLTGTTAVTVDTSSQTWTQFSGAGEITAGVGLAKTGNTLSIENSGVLTVAHGGSGATTLTGLLKGNGTSAFTAVTAPTGTIVGTSDTQVLTNKDLTGAGNTFPTFNQNTTGSAATLTTARTINGVSFNGSANITISTTTKYTGTIGDGTSTSLAVTHGLGSQYVIAQVFDATSNAMVECDVVLTSSTVVTFTFTVAPTTNQYRVVVVG